jgi:hypothetical protein
MSPFFFLFTKIAFEIAQELWNLLIPSDPATTRKAGGGGGFDKERLEWWIQFLTDNGGKVVSKDTWCLVSSLSLSRLCHHSFFVKLKKLIR